MESAVARLHRIQPIPARLAAGFTLVELMIAMTLSLLLIVGLERLYVGSRVVNRLIENSSTINEDGRFAMEFFARDIRLAGYFSCGGARSRLANALKTTNFWNRLRGIEGYDGSTPDNADANLPSDWDLPTRFDVSDMLVVRYADQRLGAVVGNDDFEPGQNRFLFDTSHSFQKGNYVILNDAACAQTSIFQVTDAYNQDTNHSIYFTANEASPLPGNCTAKLAGDYGCGDSDRQYKEADPLDNFRDAELSLLTVRAFFVAERPSDECTPTLDSCTDDNADCPTLYVAGTDVPGAVAVLTDVTDLQIEYGIDTDISVDQPGSGDENVDEYRRADQIHSADIWHQVISVRMQLEMTNADCQPVHFTTSTALRNTSTSGLVVQQ